MTDQQRQKAVRILGQTSLRRTEQRTRVLGALLDVGCPMTQGEIAEWLGGESPNKVTIYRVMESFIEAGIVHKVFLQDRSGHYELSHNCSERQCHPHFTCTDCGKTSCMTGVHLDMPRSPHEGFVIERQKVQLEGLCPKCSKTG